MEGSEGGGGGEELHPQPQPGQEDESGPSAGDEGHSEPGMHPTASDSRNSVPEGREDVGSTPEQVTGDHASDCDNSWEIICSEPGTAGAETDPDGIGAGKNKGARVAPRSYPTCGASFFRAVTSGSVGGRWRRPRRAGH